MTRFCSILIAALLLGSPAPGVRAVDRARDSASSTDVAAVHLRQARAFRTQSRQYLASAVAEYRAILRRAPHHQEAERGLARALRDQGREEEALPPLRDVADRSGQGIDSARLGWAL